MQPEPKNEWFCVTYIAWDVAEAGQSQHDEGGEQITPSLVDFETAKQHVLNDRILGKMRPIFEHTNSLEELLARSEFQGNNVDR